MDCKARKTHLKNTYFFDCQCDACQNEWPTSIDMPKSFNDLRPGQLKIDEGLDNGMALVQQVTKIQKLGSGISLEQKNGNFDKVLSYCIEFTKLLNETFHRPHSYFLMTEKVMFSMYWILYGSKRIH
jgi:hypothetical protein